LHEGLLTKVLSGAYCDEDEEQQGASRKTADMAIEAVIELEKALDGFEPDGDLHKLLLLRVLMAEYQHRLGGGRTSAQAARDVSNYVATLSRFDSLSLDGIDVDVLRAVHAELDGLTLPTSLRQTSVGVRANVPGARIRVTGSPPSDVPRRLDEMIASIYRNPALGRFEKIAFGYFELIRTHPFKDGNGRLCRLLLSLLISREFRSRPLLSITTVMRADFARFHTAIRDQDEDVYAKWLRYVAGVITAELQAAKRFDATLRAFSADDRENVLADASTRIAALRDRAAMEAYSKHSSGGGKSRVALLLMGLLH
jgi:Fic family protein